MLVRLKQLLTVMDNNKSQISLQNTRYLYCMYQIHKQTKTANKSKCTSMAIETTAMWLTVCS